MNQKTLSYQRAHAPINRVTETTVWLMLVAPDVADAYYADTEPDWRFAGGVFATKEAGMLALTNLRESCLKKGKEASIADNGQEVFMAVGTDVAFALREHVVENEQAIRATIALTDTETLAEQATPFFNLPLVGMMQ